LGKTFTPGSRVGAAIPRVGRQKKEGNQLPHCKTLVQEPKGNEENRYSDPDSKKMKINYAKEPNEAC
jgi:hypothetical protein